MGLGGRGAYHPLVSTFPLQPHWRLRTSGLPFSATSFASRITLGSGCRRGTKTSCHMLSSCTVSATGYDQTSPLAERTTTTGTSLTKWTHFLSAQWPTTKCSDYSPSLRWVYCNHIYPPVVGHRPTLENQREGVALQRVGAVTRNWNSASVQVLLLQELVLNCS